MKKSRKILIAIGAVFTVLFAGAYFILKSGIITDEFRDYVVSEINKATGKTVSIDRIEIGIFNNVSVIGINIPVSDDPGKGEFISIKSLAFRFNLIDLLLRKRAMEETISSIVINHPEVRLVRENSKFNLEEFVKGLKINSTSGGVGLPVSRVFIENGRIFYEDKDKNFSAAIVEIKGNINYSAKAKQVKSLVFGKTSDSPRRNIRLEHMHDTLNGGFTAGLEAKDIDAVFVLNYAMPDNVKVSSGKITLLVSASGEEYDMAKADIKGSALLSGCAFEIKGLPPFTGAGGRVMFSGPVFEAKDLGFIIAGGKGTASGHIRNLTEKPSYKAELTLTGADPAAFTGGFLRGSSRFIANIEGDSKRKDGKFMLFWDEGFIGKTPISGVEAEALLTGDKLRLERVSGKICGGSLDASGFALIEGKNRQLDVTAEIKNARVKDFNSNDKVSGSADLKAEFKGTLDRPSVRFRMDSAEITPEQVFQPFKSVRVTASYEAQKGRVEADFEHAGYDKAKLRSEFGTKDGFNLRRLNLSAADGNIISGSGNASKTGALSFDFNLHGITLSKLQMQFLEGKAIDALLEGKASVRGTSKSPQFAISAKSDSIMIRGKRNNFEAEAEIRNGSVNIKKASYNENLKGHGLISVKDRVFNASVDVNSLEGGQLAELLGAKIFEDSVINGAINITKKETGYGGRIKLDSEYSKGDFRAINVDIAGENNSFVFNRVEVTQKEGGAKLKGSAEIKNEELIISAAGEINNYKVNQRLKASAGVAQSLKLTIREDKIYAENTSSFSAVRFNGRDLAPLDFSFRAGNGELNDFRLKWGEEYSVEARLTGRGTPDVHAALLLKNADFYPWYLLLDKRAAGIRGDAAVSGRLEVKGPANNASVLAAISQGKGVIGLEGTVAVKKKGLSYEPDRVNIKYKLQNADLNSLVSVFDEKFKDTGTVSGEGEFKGKLSDLSSTGKVSMISGRVFDLPYDDITASYSLKDNSLVIPEAVLNYRGSFLKIEDSKVDIKKDKEYYASVKMLAKDFVWHGTRYNGPLNFAGRINNFGKLIVDGSFSSDGFGYNNHTFKPFVLRTELRGGRLSLKSGLKGASVAVSAVTDKGRITFENLKITDQSGAIQLNAKGTLRTESGDSDLIFDGLGIDPQMVNDLLGWGHKWEGKLSGSVKLSGNLKKGPDFTINVSIKNGMVDGLEYDVFSGLLTLRDNWLNLAPFGPMTLIKKDKYEINAQGRVPVPQTGEAEEKMTGVPMDVKVSMKEGDLYALKVLGFVDDASGPLDMELHITGTKEFPNVNGKVQVTRGRGKLKYLIGSLENIYANILIRNNIMDIYELRGDTQRGTIRISNLDEIKRGGVMKWMKPHEVNWKITSIGDKARLSDTDYMEYIDGNAELDLSMTGPLASPLIAGTIKASDMRFRFPVRMKTKDGQEAEVKDNYAKQISWDLNVIVGENVYYFNDILNNYAQIYAKPSNAALQVKGRGENMRLSGNVFLARGTIKYLNTEFKIDEMRESKIFFDGEKTPVLDVHAKATLRRFELNRGSGAAIDLPGGGSQMSAQTATDLEINMRAWGRFGNLNVDLSSQPVALEKNRLLFILTFGKDTQNPIGANDALRWADALANSWIKGRTEELKKYTFLDVLDIKVSDLLPVEQATPEAGTPTARPRVELGIGKYWTDSFYTRYNLRIMDDPTVLQGLGLEQTLGIEYMLNPFNKLIFDWTARDPYLGAQYEGFLGIETRWEFESWKRRQ